MFGLSWEKPKGKKFKTKVSYKDFESYFIAYPNESVESMAGFFGVSERTIYIKMAILRKKQLKGEIKDFNDQANIFHFQKGYDKGMLLGITMGHLGGKTLEAMGLDPVKTLSKLINDKIGVA